MDSLPVLYQTEWCPASHRVRQRLTELGLAVVAVPVPAAKEERLDLLRATGLESIPVLVTADGVVHAGESRILEYLDDNYDEPDGAHAHQVKAERVRRRQLEEATAA